MEWSYIEQPAPDDVEAWHRYVTSVSSWLLVSGDLHPSTDRAQTQLAQWVAAGVTDIVDVRNEWSDRKRVERWAPHIRYWSLGTHDDGGPQEKEWFDQGVDIARAARVAGGRVLVHCHMGINRGPSMAFAMLLDDGCAVAPALTAIRAARPIAAISYAADALEAHFNRVNTPPEQRESQREALQKWFATHEIDQWAVIRRIRQATADDW